MKGSGESTDEIGNTTDTYTDDQEEAEEEALNFSAMMENTGAKELFDE